MVATHDVAMFFGNVNGKRVFVSPSCLWVVSQASAFMHFMCLRSHRDL